MRISDNHIFDLSVQSLEAARTRHERMTKEAFEGRKVFTPSDDPVAAASAQQEKSTLDRLESAERGVNAGLAALQLADSALSDYGAMIVRMKELAIQQANEIYDDPNRDAAAEEVARAHEALRDLANSQVDGRYVVCRLPERSRALRPGRQLRWGRRRPADRSGARCAPRCGGARQ